MKTSQIAATCLLLSICATARDTPTVIPYELAPVLRAEEILKPESLSGPDHRVLSTVNVSAGRNRYEIETRWGSFSADGDAMLTARLTDVQALAKLEKLSSANEYARALGTAAAAPLKAATGFIKDPEVSLHDTAQGVWKFANRAGESIKNMGKPHAPSSGDPASNLAKGALGLTKAKRELAFRLGADPYSSNQVFQEKLEKVAWNSAAGSATFSLATLPIGGGLGAALTVTSLGDTFQKALRELSPQDLRALNRKTLLAMDVAPKTVDAFLANAAFSPSNQTAFVRALDALDGVKNRSALVMAAVKSADSESTALGCIRTAQLLGALHRTGNKLAHIASVGDWPAAIADDGRLILPLAWDTAYWSRATERIVAAASAAQLAPSGPLVIAITGHATRRTTAELAKRKVALLTHALDGPQK